MTLHLLRLKIRKIKVMNKEPISVILQRIMFNPLSYIHPQRIPHLLNVVEPSSKEVSAVNELLLHSLNLEYDDLNIKLSSLVQKLIRQWNALPQVAYLIGCHLLRKELAWNGASLKLPDWARHFMLIDIPSHDITGYSASKGREILCNNYIMNFGYSFLAYWAHELPKSIIQRMQILFPSIDDSLIFEIEDAEPLILLMALQYAKMYPNSVPSTSN